MVVPMGGKWKQRRLACTRCPTTRLVRDTGLMSARILPDHIDELAVVYDEDYRDGAGDACHRRLAVARCRECRTYYRYGVDTDMQVIGWSIDETLKAISPSSAREHLVRCAGNSVAHLRAASNHRLRFDGDDGELLDTRTGIAEFHDCTLRATRDGEFVGELMWSTTSYGPQNVEEQIQLSEEQLVVGLVRVYDRGKRRSLSWPSAKTKLPG